MAVTETLSDEEACLVAILTDASGLDLAEFSWYDPIDEEDGVNDGCWRARPYQWPWWRDTSPLQIDQCVAAGQRVCTARGWVPIEEVVVGDQVLTHRGRWKPVTWRWCQGERDVVSVRGHGNPGLLVTPDHQLWARRAHRASGPRDGHKRKAFSPPEWLAPRSWEWTDHSSTLTANWASPASVGGLGGVPPMLPVTRSYYVVSDAAGPAWLWLYGLFLAEGSFYAAPPTRRVMWSVHRKEAEYVEKAIRAVGLRPFVDHRGECVVLRVDSAACHAWLMDHAGRGAANKRIAPWVYGLGTAQRQAVLDGLLYGDGYERGRVWSYTTVSHQLALGVKLLAQTLGYSATLRRSRGPRTEIIEGRTVSCLAQWAVDVTRLDSQTRAQVQEVDGVMWAPVKAVTPAGRAVVYDLEVEDDHSFVVEGVVVKNCARDVGKSLGIQARAFVHPFANPGAEMVVTAPELIHLEPVTQAIEHRVFSTRLSVEMLPRARSRLTRRPFRLNFTTGARIVGRIPQVTGRGVKGLHPKILEADEMQDFPEAGWTELIATLRRGIKGAIWRAHGVTRGVRDKFWEFTQPSESNPWKVHRITAMHRPDWSDEERDLNIQLYGSRESPDYRRNILGLHGDQTNVLFVLHRLMRCVDSVEASDYNVEEYQRYRVMAEMLEDLAGEGSTQEEQARAAEHMLDFSEDTVAKYGGICWVGMDVGFTADPSEILVAVEYEPDAAERRADRTAKRASPDPGITRLRLVCRIHMERLSSPVQEAIIQHVIAHFRPRAFGMDKTGNGLPLFQAAQAANPEAAKVLRGYNFSANVIVEIDGTVKIEDEADTLKEAAITANVLEYSTDALRDLVDAARWLMPWDREMIQQFQGQTWSYSKALIGSDERRRRRVFSAGRYHALDAARMLAMAHAQAPIEEIVENLKHPDFEPVYDRFM